ncbi:hypothetical protein ACFUIW_24385 [Streptomyces sp. NPDC057245]|uniref:hypothetical protein n=1 Tax=Streptomyces TaxID=1883 RepID=UPI001C1E49F8|nr:hypothetical protein [Streptomyces sp. A108]MBU6536713.1 hypothetical protein [Streptomyces sp. A108]
MFDATLNGVSFSRIPADSRIAARNLRIREGSRNSHPGIERPPDGPAEVFSLHTRRAGGAGQQDERSYFFDTPAEYQWARDAAGLMPSSIDQLVKPVLEICEHCDLVPPCACR